MRTAVAVTLALLACSREPKVSFPPLGQTFTVLPTAVDFTGPVRDEAPAAAWHLTVMWGGRPLASGEGNPRLRIIGQGGEVREYLWADLENAWRETRCSNAMIATLDGPGRGVALVCDGSLSLDDALRIEAVDDKGEVRGATSWATYRMTDGVKAASIQLF